MLTCTYDANVLVITSPSGDVYLHANAANIPRGEAATRDWLQQSLQEAPATEGIENGTRIQLLASQAGDNSLLTPEDGGYKLFSFTKLGKLK